MQPILPRAIAAFCLCITVAGPLLASEAPVEQGKPFAAAPAGFDEQRPDIAHGRIETFTYQSATTLTRRTALVYLPPGHDASRKYPVLYLLHGIAGNEHEWTGYVHADKILDNLMADGRVVPMVVVMPNGRALADDRPPPQDKMLSPDHVASFARFEEDLLQSLIPALERKYALFGDRQHRAIAGLSMGGGQALNIGLGHLDHFASVAGFSSAPTTRPASQLLPDADVARSQLALLYLSCGRQDGLMEVSQAFHLDLEKRGIPHVWNVDAYAHERRSWAENLYQFAQRLFR